MGRVISCLICLLAFGCESKQPSIKQSEEKLAPTKETAKKPVSPKTEKSSSEKIAEEDEIKRNALLKAAREAEAKQKSKDAFIKELEAEDKRAMQIAYNRLTEHEKDEFNRINLKIGNASLWDFDRNEIDFCLGAAKPLLLPYLHKLAAKSPYPEDFPQAATFESMKLNTTEKILLAAEFRGEAAHIGKTWQRFVSGENIGDELQKMLRRNVITRRNYDLLIESKAETK